MNRSEAQNALLADLLRRHVEHSTIDPMAYIETRTIEGRSLYREHKLCGEHGFPIDLARLYWRTTGEGILPRHRMTLSRALGDLERIGSIEIYRVSEGGKALRAKLTDDGRKAAAELATQD
jgi:hypothetical protein